MLQPMFDPEIVDEPSRLRRLSRKEYDRMVELGMFEDEKVELLHGLVVTMSPQGWAHMTVMSWLAQELSIQLGHTYQVRPQGPFAADEWSEPEPDIAVAKFDPEVREHPSELLLLIEVAASSLRFDRGVKRKLYAQIGIPEYWLVDVATMTIEVYTQPSATGYAQIALVRDGDVLRPTLLPAVAIAIGDIPR